MKKQIVKGVSMMTLLVGIAFATAVVSANAQSSRLVTSTVPFDFVVGDKTMPAGEYIIKQALSNGIAIQKADGRTSAVRLTNEINASSKRNDARLVFHRYGGNYFLAEVWSGAGDPGRALKKSRQERATERELAILSRTSDASTVVIAATLR